MATGRLPDPNTAPVTAKGDLYTYSTVPAKLAVGNNGETLVADSSQSVGLRYNPQNALANPVINGAYDVWQRGTTFTIGTNTYAADRWIYYRGAYAAGMTVSRQLVNDSTNLPNIQYCARVQRDSGNTGTQTINANYSFETTNSIPFAGKTVTFSFYARKGADFSQGSSHLTFQLYSGTGTDQNIATVAYTGAIVQINTTATLTTTWQRFAATATMPTNMTEMAIAFAYSPSGTAGAADYYEVTGVQIDLGTYTASTAPTFRRSGGTLAGELAACQRYYYRIAEFQIAGGTQSAAENKVFFALNSFNGVQMRTTPTAAFESTPYVTNGASNLRTVTAVAVASKAMIGFTYDSTRLTDSYSYMINAADAGRAVSLSAEL